MQARGALEGMLQSPVAALSPAHGAGAAGCLFGCTGPSWTVSCGWCMALAQQEDKDRVCGC